MISQNVQFVMRSVVNSAKKIFSISSSRLKLPTQTQEMTDNEARTSRNKHSTNVGIEQNNPCLRESRASLKCLDDNGYDNDKCENYFANYQACLKFWSKVKRDRRWKGIKPELPPVEEREAIKKEYFGK